MKKLLDIIKKWQTPLNLYRFYLISAIAFTVLAVVFLFMDAPIRIGLSLVGLGYCAHCLSKITLS